MTMNNYHYVLMKMHSWFTSVALLGLASVAQAQFSIDLHTAGGGGGTSSGGSFSLSGTLGQPDANARPMTGGAFSLTGGFWSLFAVPTPDAPMLTIQGLSATSARVVWSSPSTGFRLQENTDLIGIHSGNARKAGATETEIAEAAMVAASLRAGAAATHATHALSN